MRRPGAVRRRPFGLLENDGGGLHRLIHLPCKRFEIIVRIAASGVENIAGVVRRMPRRLSAPEGGESLDDEFPSHAKPRAVGDEVGGQRQQRGADQVGVVDDEIGQVVLHRADDELSVVGPLRLPQQDVRGGSGRQIVVVEQPGQAGGGAGPFSLEVLQQDGAPPSRHEPDGRGVVGLGDPAAFDRPADECSTVVLIPDGLHRVAGEDLRNGAVLQELPSAAADLGGVEKQSDRILDGAQRRVDTGLERHELRPGADQCADLLWGAHRPRQCQRPLDVFGGEEQVGGLQPGDGAELGGRECRGRSMPGVLEFAVRNENEGEAAGERSVRRGLPPSGCVVRVVFGSG